MNDPERHDPLVPKPDLPLSETGNQDGPGEAESQIEGYAEHEAEAWAREAAAIQLARIRGPFEPLPEALKQRILARIDGGPDQDGATDRTRQSGLTPNQGSSRRSVNPWPWLGWIFAASLLLGLWRGGWQNEQANADIAALKRLDGQPGTQFANGLPLPNETTTGMVVWNGQKQQGYLLLDGLPRLDGRQLQLWIFDEQRDERYPVDGGVFDSQPGNQMIPIQAKLPVTKATQFAITVEPPGGVVVSKRERIVFLAKF